MVNSFTVVLLIVFVTSTLFGQVKTETNISSLTINKPIERKLKGGEAYSYSLQLKAGQFLNLLVEQRGIDTVTTLFGSDNNKLLEVNSYNGKYGIEPFFFIARSSAKYRLEVRSLEKNVPSGHYRIEIKEIRLSTEKDSNSIAAQQAKLDGMRLDKQKTEESYFSAINKYEEALNFYRAADDRFGEATMLSYIGVAYFRLGQNQKSLDYYKQALPLFKAFGGKNDVATVFGNMGVVYSRLGEKETAIRNYTEALHLFRENGDRRGEAAILVSISGVYADLGESRRALSSYEKALPIIRKVRDKTTEATTLHHIGTVYRDLGENHNALNFFKQALLIRRQSKDNRGEGATLSEIGAVYSNLGENQKALIFFNQALPLLRRSGDLTMEGKALNGIAKVYFKLGENNESLNYYNQALLINKATGTLEGEAKTLNALQSIWLSLNNSSLAIFYGKQSVNKYQELRQAIEALSKDTQKTYLKTVEAAYRQLADILIGEGLFAQAEQVLRMLKEEEYFDFVRRDSDEIKNLSQRVTLSDKEKTLIEKYSRLADQIIVVSRELQKLKQEKSRLLSSGKDLSAEKQARYEKLSDELTDYNAAFQLFLDKQLIAELKADKLKEIDVEKSSQEKLKKWGSNTVSLLTVMGEDRYRVVLTTQTVQISGKTEIKASELNKKIFAFRAALQNPNVDPRPIGKELYDILIKPIEKELLETDAATLVWSLDGTLRYIPLAALSPDGKGYLVEKYQNAVITPKTRDDLSVSSADWRALGVGVSSSQAVADPDDPMKKISFSALPGAQRELISIVRDEQSKEEKGLLSGKRFLDAGFTDKSLTNSLAQETEEGNRKYTIVHIASHFYLGSNRANSFLLLGDGKTLSLEKVSNSPEYTFGDVELVTLSACNTAFADQSNGKEVDSLAETITTKGGKAVLATLWAVADQATGILMSEFYRLRKDNPKLTKAEAIQTAQRSMIEGKIKSAEKNSGCRSGVIKLDGKQSDFKCDADAPYSHPYYWSPFVLIGNWR